VDWLVDAYEVGDLVRDYEFRDAVINLMIHCGQEIDSFPEASFVDKIYSIAPGGARVRDLMVDLWVCKADSPWIEWTPEGGLNIPGDFTEDLVLSLLRRRTKAQWPLLHTLDSFELYYHAEEDW